MQLPITVDPHVASTLQSQIVEQLRTLIESGKLQPGTPVPTSRDLGRQLAVSRNTVTGAYETLIDLGYLFTEPTVGTFVARQLPQAMLRVEGSVDKVRSGAMLRTLNLPLPYTGKGAPGLHRPVVRGTSIDFAFGRSAVRLFPGATWRRIVNDCLGGAAERISEYGDPAGVQELRQLITSYLGPARGMVVSAEQVILVAGFQQGIDLAAHLFAGTQRSVVMEAPTYRGAAFLFETYGSRVIPVSVDQHGIDVSRLPEERVKLIYVTPSHQFPTGVTMPLQRRLALLEWAARSGAYILEVDYDSDFRYVGSPLPSLQSLDKNGCVIYVNSFSRSIGPGVRLGYVVVPRDLIRPTITIKSLMDNGLPWLEQAALAQFMREGAWETHLKRLRQAYEKRREALIEAMRTHLPDAKMSDAAAGTHVFLRLPSSVTSAVKVQEAAMKEGTRVYPLVDSPAWLFEHLEGHQRSLLLGYAHLTEDQIAMGIKVLAHAVRGGDAIR
ncbi:MAG TPA: PLP-dependent aminotransferase family protein [Methylibium sp.]|nr:PLP-dependent aminotransferase family protein [Methylibium sp.]